MTLQTILAGFLLFAATLYLVRLGWRRIAAFRGSGNFASGCGKGCGCGPPATKGFAQHLERQREEVRRGR